MSISRNYLRRDNVSKGKLREIMRNMKDTCEISLPVILRYFELFLKRLAHNAQAHIPFIAMMYVSEDNIGFLFCTPHREREI
jgi:hypothetical protein